MLNKPLRLVRDALLRNAGAYPDKEALLVEGKQYTYRELLDASAKIAGRLSQQGVKRGDRVCIYMDNTFPCISSLYGILLAGAVFVIINPQTKSYKLKFILEDCEAAVLITDVHLSVNYSPVAGGIPSLKHIIVSSRDGIVEDTALLSFHDIIKNGNPIKEPVPLIPNDLAALIYTSGSTGFPKGVMQTHASMVFATESISEYLRLDGEERIMLVLPLAFDYGLYQLLFAVYNGCTLVVERSFIYPSQIYKRIDEFGVTVFPGVPTIFSTLIASYRKSGITFPSVKKVTNTAAKLPAEYIGSLKKIFPNALIFKMYGLTECKRVSYLEPELLDRKPDSVGKAIPGTEILLLDGEGKPVSPNETGILYVRGPHIMAGYWKRPDLTSRMLVPGPVPGEVMLCTHDHVRVDEEGFLYFVGRTDDIIKTRGEKVSPVEVENMLLKYEGVADALVLGLPDEKLGESVIAFITVHDEYDVTPQKIKKFCGQKLENFMVPRGVIILKSFPKTMNGKIDKLNLIEGLNNGTYTI